jgi:hypothetical protein
MVKVISIELHKYYENTLPTSKYKLIVSLHWTPILEPLSVLHRYQYSRIDKTLKMELDCWLLIIFSLPFPLVYLLPFLTLLH